MRLHHGVVPVGVGLLVLSTLGWHPPVLGARAQAEQSPPPVTFQVEVNYVDVDASVTDDKGTFVSNLHAEDFEVFEDGKPQKIDTFSLVEIPVGRDTRFSALGRPVETDTRSNRETFSGRVYVIVLDDLDISPLRTSVVKKAAREFVEQHLGTNDLAAVAYTSGRVAASQDFTTDHRLLLEAIDRFTGQKVRSAALDELDGRYLQLLNTLRNENEPIGAAETPAAAAAVGGGGTRKQFDLERNQRALNVLGTLQNLSEFLSGIRGRRKALVFISEGVDYPMQDVFGAHSASDVLLATRDTISAAARSNVNFYSIDPRGLSGLTTEFIEMQGIDAIMPQGGGAAEGANINAAQTSLTPQSVLLNELRTTQDGLRSLAEQTGGFAAVNRNVFASAFSRIVESNSRYYVLGYYPPTHPRDGQFHRIEVRMKRPDLHVNARRGYASPRGKTPADRKRDEAAKQARDAKRPIADSTSAELRDALALPMQQSGLTFAVQAAPFRGTPKEASIAVAIEFDGDKLSFTPQNSDVFASKIELSMFGINEVGRAQRGTRTEVDLTLKPANYRWVKDHGLRVNPRVNLPPGRYQFRVAARESVGGAVGSVFYDLEVPDFRKDPLMLSGMLLAAASAEDIVSVQADPVAAKVLPSGPTSRRDFIRSDVVAVYAEVYDNVTSRQARQVDVDVRLMSETGQDVFSARDTLSNGGTGTSAPWTVYGYTGRIPLTAVPPGSYVLRLEAHMRGIENAGVAAGETVITIKP